jgi:hypothetical protein
LAVQRSIHGLDLNPLGVLLTEAAIALLLVPRLRAAGGAAIIEPLNLYVTDTLRAGELNAAVYVLYGIEVSDVEELEGSFSDALLAA